MPSFLKKQNESNNDFGSFQDSDTKQSVFENGLVDLGNLGGPGAGNQKRQGPPGG